MTATESEVGTVLLAAGQATRMGGAVKALLQVGGETFLARLLRRWKDVAPGPVLVILGHGADEVERTAGEAEGVRFIRNPDFASGQTTSVQCALRSLPPSWDAALIHLVDLPMVGPKVPRKLIASFLDASRRPMAVVPTCDGDRGHPVLLGRCLFDEILSLPSGALVRDLLTAKGRQVLTVDVGSPWIHRDVDTWADLARLAGEE